MSYFNIPHHFLVYLQVWHDIRNIGSVTPKMKDMKFIRDGKWAVNLAHIIDINVSCNYLVLTTIDGREEKFIYGPESNLENLVEAILAFTADDTAHVFDCREFLNNL